MDDINILKIHSRVCYQLGYARYGIKEAFYILNEYMEGTIDYDNEGVKAIREALRILDRSDRLINEHDES